MKRSELPVSSGTLSGVKVVFAAMSVAGPFVATMCADNGADVIWIENPKSPSIERQNPYGSLDCNRKNMRSIALDIPSEEGRKVFLKIMKETDIFLESSRGGQYERWGLTDEVLWEANPKLIIIHLSGFGQSGDPDYVSRASYDPIAQAFGGLMYVNMIPGVAPQPANPMVADYVTALFGYGAALSAYIKMLRTGEGESIDLNQFEAVTRIMEKGFGNWSWSEDDSEAAYKRFVPGAVYAKPSGYDTYLCGDGNYVCMLIMGPKVMRSALPVFGLEYGSEEWPAEYIYWNLTEIGQRFDNAIKEYCLKHTAAEVEAALTAVGAPAATILTFDQQLSHPHYVARGTFTKVYSKLHKRELTIPSIYPKMKKSKVDIWRLAPSWGEDTVDILTDLGLSEEKIGELFQEKVVYKE